MYAYVLEPFTFAFFAIQIARADMFYYWGASSNQMHAKKLPCLKRPLRLLPLPSLGELLSTFSSDRTRLTSPCPMCCTLLEILLQLLPALGCCLLSEFCLQSPAL
jgi:hypothetical protein